MKYLTVVLMSLGSVIILFLLTKLMGKRQIAELSMFDYINGITIGSIAAEMATSLEDDFLEPLIAMVVYAIVSIIISLLSCKSLKIRNFLIGKPLVLIDNGKLVRNNLKKSKLDLSEFLTQCRTSGYFDISKIDTAIMESNGKISFIPISSDRPATPNDFKINVSQEKMPINIILDGVLLKDNLKRTGNEENWLYKQLKNQKISKISEIFLAMCDSNNNLIVFKK